MSPHPVDELARNLGQPQPRRALLALLAPLLAPRSAQARLCTRNGRPCRADRQCCSGHCAGRTVCRDPDRQRNKRHRRNTPNKPNTPTTQPCQGQTKRCGGRCVNVRRHRRHCGRCGRRCAAFERCRGGRCTCTGDVCARDCPFTTVQGAVAEALPGATIRICRGTYTGAVTITQALTLVGAGAAHTRLTAGQFTWILTVDAGEGEVVVSGLTVAGTRGRAGIVNRGTLTLDRCTVADNKNENGNGGGINTVGTLTLAASVVRDNEAANGAGIWTSGTLTVAAGTTITANTVTGHGGGIDNGGALTVQAGAVITENRAPLDGGGIYTHSSGTTTLEPGATVADNEPDDCVTEQGGTLDGIICPTPP